MNIKKETINFGRKYSEKITIAPSYKNRKKKKQIIVLLVLSASSRWCSTVYIETVREKIAFSYPNRRELITSWFFVDVRERRSFPPAFSVFVRHFSTSWIHDFAVGRRIIEPCTTCCRRAGNTELSERRILYKLTAVSYK